ncbi:ribose-phosphate diphosphokinase [Aurantiacibacter sp. MUD11]|uniref:ribose-phosphate diphosphokinase n=1 Tax=Aurantiacibacter sp. MUD11 TaxID=3003265 RepID=UPI0022AB397F|nr:ribose-phosphate diphosphokinase [Aurantiacibacter sp. MUD11]WAT19282.1 ribose-phosphate diphosphokinase [Aurantiacibacter sp. MUD11]
MVAAVHAFAECLGPAGQLAERLGIGLAEVKVHRFPDGESLVQVEPGTGTAVLFRSLHDPNAKLVELLLAASALRENGADRVIVIAPYLAYMRQDIAFEPGQAVSQRVIGALLAEHFDGLLTVDPHLHRIRSLAEVMPGTDACSISAAPALGQFVEADGDTVLAGPDAESRQWVEAIAAPRGLDVIVGEKRRLGDRQVELHFPGIERVAGRPVILVDDVISSGRTLEVAARQLLAGGATQVEALATHCLASREDLDALRVSGISRITSSDSIAGPTATIPLADILAQAVQERGWLA